MSKKSDAKVVERIDHARRLWSLWVQGLSYAEIARKEGFRTPAAAQTAVEQAQTVVKAFSSNAVDVDSLVDLEAARLDAMQAALWPAAVTNPMDLLADFMDEGGHSSEEIEAFTDALGLLLKERNNTVRTILDIMKRRAALLALDRQQPPANLIMMPTIVFASAGPGERDHSVLTIAPEPVEIERY
jgi:hypothetical protein